MSTIRITVEDSKVPGILEALLHSNISIKDVKVSGLKSGNKLRVSSYKYVVADLKMVGGTIFYIDDTADGVYEFLDVNGNVIENIRVGDRPYYYRVIKKGSKDKYYVYHDELYRPNKRWTYYKEGDSVLESPGTFYDIGSGKTNTEKVMTKDNGAYITEDSNGYPTIWYKLQQTRLAKVGGCDDWFVPSKDEIEELRLAVESGSVSGGEIAGSSYGKSVFNNSYVWSSSGFSSQYVWIWDPHFQGWFFCYKSNIYSVFFVRAF